MVPRIGTTPLDALPIHYPGSKAQVTEALWETSTSIHMHEHNDPNRRPQFLKDFYDRLKGEEKGPGDVIPDGMRVLLVPEGLHKRLDEYAHPNDADPTLFDKLNAPYQRLLIGLTPRPGSATRAGLLPLAFYSGATSPRDYWNAFITGPQGRVSKRLGIKRTDTRNAATQNLGLSRSLGEISQNVNPAWVVPEWGRARSIEGENFSSAAAFEGRLRVAVQGSVPLLRKIIPALDKVMPERWKGAAAQMSMDTKVLNDALRSGMFDGRPLPPELQQIQDRLIQDTVAFMSEGAKPHGELNRRLGHIILFHNWIGHIAKVTLLTLPLRHPGRAVLLNALSM